MIQRSKKIFHISAVAALIIFFIFSSSAPTMRRFKDRLMWLAEPLMRSARVITLSLRESSAPDTRERAELIEENEQLRFRQQAHELLQEKYENLRNLVGFKDRALIRVQGANVLLSANESGKEFLVVDVGKDKNIREGALAIDAHKALVGIIREVGDQFSKISLASNAGEVFDAQVIPLGIKTLARGIGGRAFFVELIPRGTPIRASDFVVIPNQFGKDAIVLGAIVQVSAGGTGVFQEARATLLAKPDTLEDVFILVP